MKTNLQSLGNGKVIAIGTILANSIINTTINTNSANSAINANSVIDIY